MRLNAYLARAGVASRRGADEMIKAGRVMVNHRPGRFNDDVTEQDEVLLDNEQISLRKSRSLLLYKPAGYITTMKDPHGRRIVTDLVNIPERVVPVGRLDYNTTGVLLLTNDGQLAHALMHPSHEADKVYEATVEGRITEEMLEKLRNGVELEDGITAPAKVGKLTDNKIELIIHEGRNHQIKRMLAAVGLTVKKLHRSKYAGLELQGLKPGLWRDLDAREVSGLKGYTRR